MTMDEPKAKELDLAFEAMMLDMTLMSSPVLKSVTMTRHPPTAEMGEKVRNAIVEAVKLAVAEPGSVVRIACASPTEIMVCSRILQALIPILKDVDLVESESSSTRFELSNNSAIMLSRQFKEE